MVVRKGPFRKWPQGKYLGELVEDVIANDPYYFMTAVKEWLDISPYQADLFEEITGGGKIPDRYIKRVSEETKLQERDDKLYYSNNDILPNWDFDPTLAPKWWPEFKERSKGLTHCCQRVDLYNSYVQRDIREGLKELGK